MTPEPNAYHEPALVAETLHYLAPKPGEAMLDATLGGGGHSAHLAQALQPGGILIGMDRDPDALVAADARLTPLRQHLSIITILSPFGKIGETLDRQNHDFPVALDGFLFDLGTSSHQLDRGVGFSFRRDEPLMMRMDQSDDPTEDAAHLLATASETEIARILWEYGEERWSRQIARKIVESRKRGSPVQTTGALAASVEAAVPRSAWPRDIHVATRTFQALRIAVNDELNQLEAGLNAALTHLNPGGRVVVISYHSLEDRIVKRIFARGAGKEPSPPGSSPAAFLPNRNDPSPDLILLTRKPVLPTDAEIARNPRARSAKLRAIMRRI